MTSIIYRCFYVCTDLDEIPWFFVTSQIFDDTIIIFTRDCNNNNLLFYTYIHLMQPMYCFGYFSYSVTCIYIATNLYLNILWTVTMWRQRPKIDYLMFKSFSYVRLVFPPSLTQTPWLIIYTNINIHYVIIIPLMFQTFWPNISLWIRQYPISHDSNKSLSTLPEDSSTKRWSFIVKLGFFVRNTFYVFLNIYSILYCDITIHVTRG